MKKKPLFIFLISMVLLSCSNKIFLSVGSEYIYYDEFHFKFNSDSLFINESKDGIDSIIKMVKNSKNRFEVEVHSGIRGSDAYNLNMTKKRAKCLHLQFKKINKKVSRRIVFRGYGKSQLIFIKNDLENIYDIHGNKIDKNDKRQNRRIVLKVIE